MPPATRLCHGLSPLIVLALAFGIVMPVHVHAQKDDKSSSATTSADAAPAASTVTHFVSESDDAGAAPASPSTESAPTSNPDVAPAPAPDASSSSSSSPTVSTSPPATTSLADVREAEATTLPDLSLTSGDNDGLTGLPTLSGAVPIPTYLPAAVPDTKDAPFMRHSTVPEGTFFIGVGAVLGAFFLGVLLWRALTTILLHRSVKRANEAQSGTGGGNKRRSSSSFPELPEAFYNYADNGSSRSVAGPFSQGRANRRSALGGGINMPAEAIQMSLLAAAPNSPLARNSLANARFSASYNAALQAAAAGLAPPPGAPMDLRSIHPDLSPLYMTAIAAVASTRQNASTSSVNLPGGRLNASTSSVNLPGGRLNASTSSVYLQGGAGRRFSTGHPEGLLVNDFMNPPPPRRGSENTE